MRTAARGLLRRGGEFVADAMNGVQVARTICAVADRTPDAADMNVDRSGIPVEIEPPETFDELIAREDASVVSDEQPQHVELARFEVDLASAQGHFAPLGVHREIARDAPLRRRRRRRSAAPEDGADTRDEFPRRER